METKNWTLKLTLLLVSSLTIMSIITISPAIPQMARVFSHVKDAAFLVKLVLTLPALMIAVVSPIAGRLIDRHGRLPILRFALVLYAIAGAAGFLLNNLYFILLSRAVLGIAVGMSMTIVITLIADYFEGPERQKFVGLQIAFMSLGGILFTCLGGVLSDISWRFPFLLYLSSLLILPLVVLFLPEPPAPGKNVQANRTVQAPPVIWMLFINTMVMWLLFFLIPVQVPFYLKAIGVEKNSFIGAAIAMSTAFSAVSSFFYARIRNRLSFLSVFSIGYLLMAAGFVCMALAKTYLLVVIAMMLAGLGIGMMIPNTNMWVMKIAPPEIRGKEIGKLTTFWFLGQFLSPIMIYPVLNSLSLSSTFMVASGFLLLVSLLFMIFQFSRFGQSVLHSS
ncbi:MAG TPA: MFS transporter [Flavisolibacter sp.]|jgi:MFS family permease|nr:MFS transporter [Flavisolibacter sp.]